MRLDGRTEEFPLLITSLTSPTLMATRGGAHTGVILASTHGWISGSGSRLCAIRRKKKSTESPPEFHRNSTPPPAAMGFWEDVELPRHRWFVQLPKLAPGRRFDLAPPTEGGRRGRRPTKAWRGDKGGMHFFGRGKKSENFRKWKNVICNFKILESCIFLVKLLAI